MQGDMMNISTGALVLAGGSEWQKAGNHRVYFNNLEEWFGLECEYYGSGNVRSAKLNGKDISNSYARTLAISLRSAKLWYDVRDGKFYAQGLSPLTLEEIVNRIKARAGIAPEPIPEGYVRAECGHMCREQDVMSASLGHVCPRCFESGRYDG